MPARGSVDKVWLGKTQNHPSSRQAWVLALEGFGQRHTGETGRAVRPVAGLGALQMGAELIAPQLG
jgi:hypothetical protein